MPELKEEYVCPTVHTRAEPDDEYPRPEPLKPSLIDRYQYPEDDGDENLDDENLDDEMDERNYSS